MTICFDLLFDDLEDFEDLDDLAFDEDVLEDAVADADAEEDFCDFAFVFPFLAADADADASFALAFDFSFFLWASSSSSLSRLAVPMARVAALTLVCMSGRGGDGGRPSMVSSSSSVM